MRQKKRIQLKSTFPYRGRGREGGGKALISYKDNDYHNKEGDLSILAYFHHNVEEKRKSEHNIPAKKKKTSKLNSTLCGNLHD